MNTIEARLAERVDAQIDVEIETVLDHQAGRITNLSASGAKIEGQPFPVGQTIKIMAGGDALWAKVRWAAWHRREPDAACGGGSSGDDDCESRISSSTGLKQRGL